MLKAEVEWFYEDLQDVIELIAKKDVLFIIGDWNRKVGSQEIPGVTGKLSLGVQNEAGQMAIVMQMSRQESRSSAGPDHVTLQALITWLIKSRSRD